MCLLILIQHFIIFFYDLKTFNFKLVFFSMYNKLFSKSFYLFSLNIYELYIHFQYTNVQTMLLKISYKELLWLYTEPDTM